MNRRDNRALYWIWLQRVLGYGNPRIRQIAAAYPNIEDFYHASLAQKRLCAHFTPAQENAFSKEELQNSQTVIDRCESLNYNIITFADEIYPKRLKEIYNPPCVLYVDGALPKLDDYLCVAVVGTRTATREGVRTAFTMSADLARAGAVVVSGGALGIDCAAHRGVLQSGGVTVCVLGCGINCRYLMENEQMRRLITVNGAVISEYPPDFKPLARNFPMRNRIISGLSNGVLVVEAGEKSGSLITAALALEQNRDVFAVPGSITNTVCRGSNTLIKQGARAVTSFSDILEEYLGVDELPEETPVSQDFEREINAVPTAASRAREKSYDNPQPAAYHKNDMKPVRKENGKEKEPLTQDAQAVLGVLSESEIPLHVDLLIERLGLPAGSLLAALTELELSGLVRQAPGRRYCRV